MRVYLSSVRSEREQLYSTLNINLISYEDYGGS